MTPAGWLTLVLAAGASVGTSVPASATQTSATEELDTSWLLDTAPKDALRARIVEMSGRFLGTPYVHSPLGEGEGIDPDPTIRFDAVDCLTFVEETLALSLARDPSDVRTLLVALRYADRPAFEDRNHLMEAQWLPNNVRKGFLRDVTRMYGGADTVVTKKVISKAAWQVPSSKALQLPPDRQVVGEFPLELIPLQKVLDHARDIPSGTVLMVAREDRPNKVTRITHLGFVVQKDGRTFLRHAARNIYRRVVDEDLRDFLLRNSKYSKWKVSGVALYEPVDPAR